jgi:hypothetical protein
MATRSDSTASKVLLIAVGSLILIFCEAVQANGRKSVSGSNSAMPVKKVAWYLAKEPLDAFDIGKTPVNDIPLEDKPIFTSDDILRYDTNTHSFTLTDEAFERVRQLKISTRGRPFVVTVADRRIYWGAFWSMLSSFSFDGIVIPQPMGRRNEELRILRGSPQREFEGQDARNDPEILEVMKGRQRDGR